jgi:hypothetical protein
VVPVYDHQWESKTGFTRQVAVFKKGYSADYVEFMLMWLALRGAKVNSPYSLHYAVNNNLILKDYKDDSKRQDVINRYAYRFG